MSDRTITLTDRPPVQIIDAEWPEIGGAGDDTGTIRVRRHRDGRVLVYTTPPGARGGELVTTGAVADAVRRVGRNANLSPTVMAVALSSLPAEAILPAYDVVCPLCGGEGGGEWVGGESGEHGYADCPDCGGKGRVPLAPWAIARVACRAAGAGLPESLRGWTPAEWLIRTRDDLVAVHDYDESPAADRRRYEIRAIIRSALEALEEP